MADGDFIYLAGATALPSEKRKLYPRPAYADPDQWIEHTEWNRVAEAGNDIRTVLRGGKWYGLEEQAADPAPAGVTTYLWAKTDHTLHLVYSGVNRQLLMLVAAVDAVFDGSTDAVAVTWPSITGTFRVVLDVVVDAAAGFIAVQAVTRTATGCTVQASAPFTGTVTVLCLQ